MTDIDLDELRSELAEFAPPEKAGGSSAREQRIIAGFEEIVRFVEQHDRLPQHGEDRDIFERLYAVRLDRLRSSSESIGILKDRDSKGLLGVSVDHASSVMREDETGYLVKSSCDSSPSDEELLAALRDDDKSGITELKHVRSREEIRAAEEVAQRNPCADFELFRPLFEKVQSELEAGIRQTLKYKDNADVKKADLFILDGQKVFVADMGDLFVGEHGRPDRRLRVIYDNATESDLLVRSLQRALNKDKVSRRITEPELGPLFSGEESEDDLASGHIYVLRSLSEHPFVAENRKIIHKIGVTGGDIKKRISQAKKDPTYLLADVEIVGSYKLSNVSRIHLEALLHKFFSGARLDLELKDRFGEQVEPREWYLVPLSIIEEAIEKIKDGTIIHYKYNPASVVIEKRG